MDLVERFFQVQGYHVGRLVCAKGGGAGSSALHSQAAPPDAYLLGILHNLQNLSRRHKDWWTWVHLVDLM